jgi:tyrosyl-tRNA synthetase
MTPVATTDLLDDLEARGLIADTTDRAALRARLAAGPVTLYCGFDPTADSLHVGSLLGLIALRRFAEAGHRPLVLAGGATGMIGDPSGRSNERNLLDEATLSANVAAIKAQITRLLGPSEGWELVDNLDWTGPLTLLDFLRDVGRHVTVNQMIAKESVKARMQSEHGISYTEFSYMLLQAHDYWWLHAERGCELQVGGSDQWGNITAGIDLVRRRSAQAVHGLTWPLLLRADGTKFGKSAAGENIWLDPARTSPYRFFQYWLQVGDDEVERLLARLTLLPLDAIADVVAEHQAAPQRRHAQRVLARELTALVHGPSEATTAEAAGAALFGGSVDDLDEATFEVLSSEVPTVRVPRAELLEAQPGALLHRAGLAASASEGHRAVKQGGFYVNNERRTAEDRVSGADLRFGRYLLVRRGRREQALLISE